MQGVNETPSTMASGKYTNSHREDATMSVRPQENKESQSEDGRDEKTSAILNAVSSSSNEDTRNSKQKRASMIQFLSLCLTLILGGWNDGGTGALLPRIQTVYNVKYIIVSMIFLFACLGFMAGSIVNLYVTPRLGFGKTLIFGSVLQVIAYAIQAPGPPFPIFVLGFFISGMGISLQDAQANGFVGSLKYHAISKMGIIHSAYGFGKLLAPFASTQFAQQHRWSFFYLVSLGLSMINLTIQLTVFGPKSLNDCLARGGEPTVAELPTGHRSGLFRQVMHSWPTHIIALFIALHLGVTVTLSGWIVTYIITVRGGGPSSGYIAAGISGGATLGRFFLIKVNQKIGERKAIVLYSLFCIVGEIIIWRVPSLVANAIVASVIGIFTGPMYPVAVNQAVRLLPEYMLTGSIGWIAGFGQTGSALMPFVTGAIASKAGLQVMPPILVGLTVLMMIAWMAIPSKASGRA